jgi:two-component system sensor histidine kinase PilS (NtrC family)
VTGWLAQRVAANESLARQRGRALETQLRVNQLVIADMQDGVLVLDRDGRVAQHNPQAQRLLGAGSLRGVRARAPAARLRRALARLARRRRGRGARRARRARARPAPAPHGDRRRRAARGAVRRGHHALARGGAALKLAALGRLTANIAHEIRNPLSAISHAAELLDEEKRGATAAG